jgi:hypothetical protein
LILINPIKNTPIDSTQNIPLALLGQRVPKYSIDNGRQRRYTRAQELETLAVSKYKGNGKGISYKDLLTSGLAFSKRQAQITLKHCFKRNILFTLGNYKPQQYYPVCLKSEISKKNILVGVSGVNHFMGGLLQGKQVVGHSNLDPIIVQTLEGYILPLLPKAPLHIHKMQLKVKVPSECYHEIALPVNPCNKGKQLEDIIGRTHVRYHFYANGTVMVFTENSNNPFKLEDDLDLASIIAFFGQLRDRLVVFLNDRHERVVPGIMEWSLTQWDANKDIVVNDLSLCSSINIQVKHLTHILRIYIKSAGEKTVCRVEESCTSKRHLNAIEMITAVLNPCEELTKEVSELRERLIQIENKR